MKYTDLNGLSKAELLKRKRELAKQRFDLNMKNSMGQLANPMMIRTIRRDMARINTALNTRGEG